MPENRKKILIVHNYYQIPGGEDTVVQNEKKMLEEHGYEVTLYTRHNSELKELSKLQKIFLPFSTIFNWKVYKTIQTLIKEKQIQVVHVHNTLNMISPSVYYAALHCKVPVVQTIHNFRLLCPGADFFRDGKICEDCLKKGMMCAVKHGCYRDSKVQTLACVVSTLFHRMTGVYGKLNYICLTEFNKKKILQLKQIKEHKVHVKPNFVEPAKTVIPFSERENQFIYAGRLDETKGIQILLQAWSVMGENAPQLLICGNGPLENWCKNYIEQHRLKTVKMVGFVPNEQVKDYIGASKALILPTQWYEGFPMTILEAYSRGTPVIGSDLGNTGSLIIEGKSGMKFCHSSAEDLAKTVKEMEQKRNFFDEAFITKYSLQANYEQLREIYETCCNNNEYSGTV